ncbi:DUF2306 domain-containing protein [Microbacterium helvum]|nr:DUF2306 domain-containing protein [Microbacterium helvum]
MTSQPIAPPRTARRATWRGRLIPAGLIALSLVPVVAGAARVSQLAGGGPVTAANARFFDSPAPVIVHIIGSTVFLLLGALQFAPELRRRAWHRRSGRLVAPAGLLSALSAAWMTLFYDLPSTVTGPGLSALRLVLAAAMAGGIVVAFAAIRRGDVRTHRAWMVRAYAIGLGAGTQVLTFLPWTLVAGTPSPVVHTLLMAAGWGINLAVAEIVIRRSPGPRARRADRPSAPTAAPLS